MCDAVIRKITLRGSVRLSANCQGDVYNYFLTNMG